MGSEFNSKYLCILLQVVVIFLNNSFVFVFIDWKFLGAITSNPQRSVEKKIPCRSSVLINLPISHTMIGRNAISLICNRNYQIRFIFNFSCRFNLYSFNWWAIQKGNFDIEIISEVLFGWVSIGFQRKLGCRMDLKVFIFFRWIKRFFSG